MKKVIILIISLLAVIGCSSKKNVQAPGPGIAKFCIPDSIMSKVTMDSVTYKPVINEFNLIGKVTYDQDKVVRIYPMVSGNVTEVKATLGDYVKKGQVLAIIESSEITSAENDIVTARANLAVSEKNLAATEDMFKSGIASEKEYIAAREEAEKARSELNKADTILSIYGGEESDYIVKAPVSGFIVEKFVNPGMQIRPDNTSNLFTISDLSKVWVLASVFETEISGIKIGEKVNITTISYPDKVFNGSIDKIYNVLDPDNKTMQVRIRLDNRNILLKPEMYARVAVHQVTDSVMLAIPSKSVVFDQNKYWVVIFQDRCNVHASQVDIAGTANSFVYVRSGVRRGEEVITSLQLLIYNGLNQ